MADNDVLDDDSAEIAALEQQQKSDKGTIGGEPKAEPVIEAKQPEPAKPDPDEPSADDTLDDPNKGKFIRHGAFHAERERRKAAEARAAAQEAKFAQTTAQMQQRLMAMLQAQQTQVAPKAEPVAQALPNKDVDPVGYLEALATKNAQDLQKIQQWQQQQEQGTQRQTQLGAMQQEVARLESQFKATVPDYDAAQKHLEQSWITEAKAAGYQDHQMPQVIAARTMEIIQAAAMQNGNPAQLAYNVAKARGYALQAQQPGNNLDTVARGLAVSKSPTTAQGQSPSATPALDALLQMPEDEFAKAVEGSNWEKIRRQMMGGNASGASY